MTILERHERPDELPGEIAAVRSWAVEQPAEGVMSLCTAHKSKGLEFGLATLVETYPGAELRW